MADRDPCPHRIVGDVGGAFAFGLGGGGIWHSVKGFRNSPKGQGTQGALKAVMVREAQSRVDLPCRPKNLDSVSFSGAKRRDAASRKPASWCTVACVYNTVPYCIHM